MFERDVALSTMITQRLQADRERLVWKRPRKNRKRGQYCFINLPPQLVRCGCTSRVWGRIRVWRGGSKHGVIEHACCGERILFPPTVE